MTTLYNWDGSMVHCERWNKKRIKRTFTKKGTANLSYLSLNVLSNRWWVLLAYSLLYSASLIIVSILSFELNYSLAYFTGNELW